MDLDAIEAICTSIREILLVARRNSTVAKNFFPLCSFVSSVVCLDFSLKVLIFSALPYYLVIANFFIFYVILFMLVSLCTANNQIRAEPRRNLSILVQISGVSGDQW